MKFDADAGDLIRTVGASRALELPRFELWDEPDSEGFATRHRHTGAVFSVFWVVLDKRPGPPGRDVVWYELVSAGRPGESIRVGWFPCIPHRATGPGSEDFEDFERVG